MALLKVKVEGGWVEGLPSDCPQFSLFKGIPFAAPPVGELRWKAPQPVVPWEGVYKAYKYAKIPMQPRTTKEGDGSTILHEMSEDCLYLNVWTPAKSADEKLPVIMYTPGGGFTTGYSHRYYVDGDGFCKHGVILVSISYRVNIFGYLAHPELNAESETGTSGNYGALDIIAGLKWVKNNIAAFGGDPDNITVCGQSAGSIGTMTLCACKDTQKLFKRAISMSVGGSAEFTEYWVRKPERYIELGERFIKFLGVGSIAEARKIPTDELFKKLDEFNHFAFDDIPEGSEFFRNGATNRFRAPIDGYAIPDQLFILEREGKLADVEYMMGSTIGDLPGGDRQLPAFAEAQLRLGRAPVYMYRFAHIPSGLHTAIHGSDLEYMFQTLKRSTRPLVGKDFEVSDEMCARWSAFAKNGNPNVEGLPYWTPYVADSKKLYDLGGANTMIDIPKKEGADERIAYLLDGTPEYK